MPGMLAARISGAKPEDCTMPPASTCIISLYCSWKVSVVVMLPPSRGSSPTTGLPPVAPPSTSLLPIHTVARLGALAMA